MLDFCGIYGRKMQKESLQATEIPWIRIYNMQSVESNVCCNLNSCPCGLSIFFYHILLQGWLMLQHPGVFWQSSSCSRNVSELDMAASTEMRFDDLFPIQKKGVSADFRSLKIGCLSAFELQKPRLEKCCFSVNKWLTILMSFAFIQQCMMITKILHQLRPGRQYTLFV